MRVLFLSFFIVVADQISKLFVKGFSIPFLHINIPGLHYGESINVIGSILKITFVENPGMAFGIDVGSSKIFLSLFSLVASIGILIYIYRVRNHHIVFRISLALIFAGAVGNLIDRTFYGLLYGYAPIFFGKVVDFIHVNYFGFTIFGKSFSSFPIFNVADSSVTVGVFILLIFNYLYNRSITEKLNLENLNDSGVELNNSSTNDDDNSVTPTMDVSKDELLNDDEITKAIENGEINIRENTED